MTLKVHEIVYENFAREIKIFSVNTLETLVALLLTHPKGASKF